MNIETTHISHTETQMDKLKKENGFTLLEVLVAITIFAVGLLAVAALQTSAIKMNSTSNKLTNLSTVAMDQIEKLSALPYTHGDLTAGSHNPSSPSADYTITYTVTDTIAIINFVPVSTRKNIAVTVSGRGKTENITFFKPNVGVL